MMMTDARNKVGGHVFSKNRAGAYVRTKVSPSQPASLYSANVRARLSNISIAWRGLGAAAIALWNNAVSEWKSTDIFGDVKVPSGFNLYQKLNNNASIIGASAITTPPAPVAVPCFSTFSVAADNSDNAVTVTFAAAIAATEKVKLFASAAQSGGKSFAKSELRLIGVLTSSDTSPFVATTMYNAKFGAVGAAGKKIFIAAEQVKIATGQAGARVSASCVITS